MGLKNIFLFNFLFPIVRNLEFVTREEGLVNDIFNFYASFELETLNLSGSILICSTIRTSQHVRSILLQLASKHESMYDF